MPVKVIVSKCLSRLLCLGLLHLICSYSAVAQIFQPEGIDQEVEHHIKPTDVIIWQAAGGEVIQGSIHINLRLQTRQNFTVYKDKLTIAGSPGYRLTQLEAPEPVTITDPLTGELTEVYGAGEFIATFSGPDVTDSQDFVVAITFLGCTSRLCLFPYTQSITVPIYITETTLPPPQTATKLLETDVSKQEAAAPSPETTSEGFERQWANKITQGELPFGLLLVVILIGGLLTNLTPCVFPMIPITVRILGKQGQRPWLASSCYAFGIMTTYTAIGSLAAATGSLFGSFMAHPIVNVVFAGLFILLGLSLLGWVSLDKLQVLGSKLGSSQGGLINTFLMGCGAGLVAAPCTGPILGALLVYATQIENQQSASLLFLIYSLGFAAPYVFLGTASGKISRWRAPAALQLGTKLVFAAAMFGLAAYYLRIPFHKELAQLDGFWATMTAGCASLAILSSGFYLLRYPQSTRIATVSAMLIGLSLFQASQWLSGNDLRQQQNITWIKSIDEAFALSKSLNRPVLMDGWAEWCEACKKMDRTTFLDPQLAALIHQGWVPLKVDLTAFSDENQNIADKYGMQGLPTTLLLPPGGAMQGSVKLTGYLSAKTLIQHMQKFEKR